MSARMSASARPHVLLVGGGGLLLDLDHANAAHRGLLEVFLLLLVERPELGVGGLVGSAFRLLYRNLHVTGLHRDVLLLEALEHLVLGDVDLRDEVGLELHLRNYRAAPALELGPVDLRVGERLEVRLVVELPVLGLEHVLERRMGVLPEERDELGVGDGEELSFSISFCMSLPCTASSHAWSARRLRSMSLGE